MTNLNRPDRRPNRCPTLRMGNRGSAVAFVQNLLRQRRYVLRVDGVFGQRTRNVVLNFQRDNGLNQTGNVDGATWRALGVTCLSSQYFPPVTLPETLPSFPSTPSFQGQRIYRKHCPVFRKYLLSVQKMNQTWMGLITLGKKLAIFAIS